MERFVLVVVLLLASIAAQGQVVRVEPPNPTSVDSIILDVGVGTPQQVLQPIVVIGTEVRITFRGSSSTPSVEVHRVSLGRLPAGSYSVIVTMILTDAVDEVVATITLPPYALQVHEGFIVPALDAMALFGLAIGMALGGLLALRR